MTEETFTVRELKQAFSKAEYKNLDCIIAELTTPKFVETADEIEYLERLVRDLCEAALIDVDYIGNGAYTKADFYTEHPEHRERIERLTNGKA